MFTAEARLVSDWKNKEEIHAFRDRVNHLRTTEAKRAPRTSQPAKFRRTLPIR